ncbi:MAG: hypothetical protein JXL81_12155 [Deltaproteobacteria bacterium]|nr:hypothetical protein [Deltaproteobacteria bacterium]
MTGHNRGGIPGISVQVHDIKDMPPDGIITGKKESGIAFISGMHGDRMKIYRQIKFLPVSAENMNLVPF